MPHQIFYGEKTRQGFTLVEVLIALMLSAIMLTIIVSLYTTSAKTFQSVKDSSDAKEIAKDGMERLEWLFQRWGTSTPCSNPNLLSCTSVAQDCQVNGAFSYPPPSSICLTILDTNPDEVVFYANLYGSGFVHLPAVSNPGRMNIKSCRLSNEPYGNCYYIKMGARFLTDRKNTAVYTPLVFSLSALSDNNLVCTDGTAAPNGTVSATVTANNGFLDEAGTVDTYTLEGGEVILRVPHRIRLYCRPNNADGKRRWLYLEMTDMASACFARELPQPLIPVNSFNVVKQGEGVVVTMQVRGTNGKVMDVQRYYGR